jgi:hypothetical protein
VQLNRNATGASTAYGLLKPYVTTYLKKRWCNVPQEPGAVATGGLSDNVFVQIAYVTGTCNSRFSSPVPPGLVTSTIAVNPDPNNPASAQTWKCGDQVLLVNLDQKTNDSIKVVQDLCPVCSQSSGFKGTNGHIDTYTTANGCKASDPTVNLDYGKFYGIRIRPQ